NIFGDTAGLASAAGGTDTTSVSFTTLVDIGGSANMKVKGDPNNPGDFNLSAFNDFKGRDEVTFKTGGAISGAAARADIHANADIAHVTIHDGATLGTVGTLDIAVNGTANVSTQVNTDTYGAVTAAVANSYIDIRPDNQIIIGAATISARGDLNFQAGENTLF